MFDRIHQRLGTAGFVISIVALVAALGGGAYAATGASSGGKATASAKAKQGKQGKPGKPGKPGPAGPQGPAGPAGPAGPKGDAGAAGSNGSPGTNGKSVVLGNTAPKCGEGGISVEVEKEPASKKEVCNGESAEGGGFPKTLPEGATETGSMAFETVANFQPGLYSGIGTLSFPTPLESELAASHVVLIEPGKPISEHCSDGTGPSPSVSNPEAASGYLCVFLEEVASGKETLELSIYNPAKEIASTIGAAKTGAFVREVLEASEPGFTFGTWAVTG